ncbi:MAG TPA: PVC-type heme-binding CxxCH protein [Planctomycetota bacterium]|nr:PVC-type heme-binding CxxCH protein [Planctomycetota bacterium]
MRVAAVLAGIFALAAASLNLCAGQAKAIDFNNVVRQTEALSPEEERQGFHLPPGFEIQLVACEPEINKPINLAFDAAGRLWVTSTVEYPFPAKEPAKARDCIKVLSDFDKNGKARKVETFADGLNIPVGVLPYGHGAIGHSIPFIYYFEDTTGAGKSDKRSVLLDRIGYQKDTHGMSGNFVRGFDGWVYATHGFNNDSVVKALDGSEIKMNSGNTYRFRPDGSHIEQFTWGQVNPFGLALDALGNLYSADCETKPMYQLLRGGYYPSFGKKDDGLGFAPVTMTYMHGSTAVGGIVIYSDERFPAEFRNNGFTGNVMTSKINRDLLVDTGTTRTAKELPDFLTAGDPWFRPVCLQLGPDGAMYVADFYNRIIGHYEVPLTHPGRDRERGRIWRIVYTGTPEKPIADALPMDLTKKNLEELIALTGEPNLTLRMMAMFQIVDRIGMAAIPELVKHINAGNSNQRICAVWALYNLGAISADGVAVPARDIDPAVRIHAMKLLAEFGQWTDFAHNLALDGLKDADPWVRRAAADALGRHPAVENVRPLIALRQSADPKDTHLIHVVRMALRNHLLVKGMAEKIAALNLSEKEMEIVSDVCLGAASEESAAILVRYLSAEKTPPANAAKFLEHAIKYLPFNEIDALVAMARSRFGGDESQQLALLKSIQDGAARRGMALSAPVRAWAVELLSKVLGAETPVNDIAWTALTLDGKANAANPWVPQNRVSADGKSDEFLSSLPLGEKLTGVYRSKTFDVPAKLEFYMAGHNGQPPKVHPPKNFIRLRDAATNELLMEAIPPRNDTAQKFDWDLAKHAGRKGVLELIDGDDAAAYAWLAVGRFVPAVVEIPNAAALSAAQKTQTAAELAGQMKINEIEAHLAAMLANKKLPEAVRGASAAALVSINGAKHGAALAAILNDASEANGLRERAAEALGGVDSAEAREALIKALSSAPDKFQTKIAQALCVRAEGVDALLQTLAAGKASPRVLFDRGVKDRLAQLKLAGVDERIAKLTAGLQPTEQRIQNLINQRVKEFQADKASLELGAKIFEKNCTICHQLDGKGASIGPQLDGVGARGLDRIVEDVLDPSRNVDAAFRVSLVKLANGQAFSGLKRREEGEQIVFADSKGVETSYAKTDIKEMRESMNSLMPDGFETTVSAEDFNHLMAYLLSKTVKR